MQNIQIAYTAM